MPMVNDRGSGITYNIPIVNDRGSGITYLMPMVNDRGSAIINDRDSALDQYKILKKLDTELANKLFDEINK
jgi:hypothetical protein